MYLGDYAEDYATLNHKFTTRALTGIPTVLAGSPVISVYKGSATATEKTSAEAYITLTVDFDSVVGCNHILIDLSGDAFFATGEDYQIVLTTGTVDGVSVVGETIATFSIENRFMRGTDSANTTVPDAAGVVATALGLLETHGDSTWATATGFNTVTPDAAGVVATALGLLETHGDSTWATATGFNTTVPDAAGVVATALGLLETHGDSTWATATGFNTVTPDAAGVVATALGLLETHGDSTWATATGFNTVTPDAAGVMATALGLLETHGDSTWATATGFNTVTPDAAGVVATALGLLETHGDSAWATGGLDAAGTRAALGMASANLDTQLGTVAKTGADSDTLKTLSDQIDAIDVSGVADAVWDELQAGHTDAGSFGAYLDSAISGVGGAVGAGGDTVTMTLTVGGVGLPDAGLWISSDSAGAVVVAGTLYTDVAGQQAFQLDNGSTYYFWAKKVGYNLPQGTEFVAADAHTFTGTEATALDDLTDVLAAIRRALNDEQTGQYQWSDTVLLRYLSDAQRALYRHRPDVFLGAGGMNKPVELESTAAQLKVDVAYRDVLVWHACASALGEDAEDRGNLDKAAEFMGRFNQAARGMVNNG